MILAGGKDFYDLVTVKSLAPTFQFYNETLKIVKSLEIKYILRYVVKILDFICENIAIYSRILPNSSIRSMSE